MLLLAGGVFLEVVGHAVVQFLDDFHVGLWGWGVNFGRRRGLTPYAFF
jgi:hypothetical protein